MHFFVTPDLNLKLFNAKNILPLKGCSTFQSFFFLECQEVNESLLLPHKLATGNSKIITTMDLCLIPCFSILFEIRLQSPIKALLYEDVQANPKNSKPIYA